jgi:hypothetical protein
MVQAAVTAMRQLVVDGRVTLVKNYGLKLIDPIPFEPLGEPCRFLTSGRSPSEPSMAPPNPSR